MSTAAGIAQMMVGAGWWPWEGEDSTDAALTVERTEEDEVAVTFRPVGAGEQEGIGTLYLTVEMAAQLSSMLIEQAADSAWERTRTAAS